MQVNLEDIKKHIEFCKKINETPLDDIEWFSKGKLITPSKHDIKEFKFCGLSNIYFGMDLLEAKDE
jgi:hypothetical protein